MEILQKKLIYVVYILAISATVILLLSCNSPTEVDGISGITIIPGVSINGIKLGDTKARVESILGKPTSKGWADGSNRGWTLYIYSDSSEKYHYFERYKVMVSFLEYGTDFDTVDVMSVGTLYKGITELGIGIGSSLKSVHQAYGIPDTSRYNSFSNSNTDIYCINNKWFSIYYIDSLITRMSFGNFKPYPAIPYCK